MIDRLGTLLLVLAAANATIPTAAAAQSAFEIYERGTDIGMLYLSEHMGRLQVTVLLQECGFAELASAVAVPLPDPVPFFTENHAASSWDPAASASAAQVMRGYLLGFETGIRSAFRRELSEDRVRATCAVAAAAAGRVTQSCSRGVPKAGALDGPRPAADRYGARWGALALRHGGAAVEAEQSLHQLDASARRPLGDGASVAGSTAGARQQRTWAQAPQRHRHSR